MLTKITIPRYWALLVDFQEQERGLGGAPDQCHVTFEVLLFQDLKKLVSGFFYSILKVKTAAACIGATSNHSRSSAISNTAVSGFSRKFPGATAWVTTCTVSQYHIIFEVLLSQKHLNGALMVGLHD